MTDKLLPDDAETGPPGGRKPLLIGLLAALVLGGGGFYATYSGLIGGGGASPETQEGHGDQTAEGAAPMPGVAFVPLEPLVVSLGNSATNRYLRFGAQLEVEADAREDIATLTPRVLDVLNGYLRAVDSRDIEDPASLGRLRAQMLRRVQVVTGEGRVRDLLVTEFVLN